jgi:hypothetical protein
MGNNGLRTLGGSVSGVSSIAVRKSKMRKKKKKQGEVVGAIGLVVIRRLVKPTSSPTCIIKP